MRKKTRSNKQALDTVVDFLFEVGMLAKTPRSGFFFLGSGEQSVSEHITRVAYIGYVLAHSARGVDRARVVYMCLFHDLTEARVSDLNYVHQKYTERKEQEALRDLTNNLPFGKEINTLIDEYHQRTSREALLAKDADNLEFILSLKEQIDIGNTRAQEWLPPILKRLVTPEARSLARAIIRTDSDRWWFGDKHDSWWVSRRR